MVQKRTSRRSQKHNDWSSSVIGTHASSNSPRPRSASRPSRSGGAGNSARTSSSRTSGGTRGTSRGGNSTYTSRRSPRNLNSRTAEIHQMRPNATPLNAHVADRESNREHMEAYARKQRRKRVIMVVVLLLLVVCLAFGLGSCVFTSSLSGSMAINDDEVATALTPQEEGQPSYILLAGVNEQKADKPKSSFVALLRVNPEGGRMTLVAIPTNMQIRLNGKDAMLRDVITSGSDADLITTVASQTECEINHYVRISDEGLKSLVDSLGGIEVDVAQRVDDPRYSSIVIDPGVQTLNGEQALMYVSAANYSDGKTMRAQNQATFFQALANSITARSGFDFMMSADAVARNIKTDMSYSDLESLAQAFGKSDSFSAVVMPGTQAVVNDRTFFYASSASWPAIRELFQNGEEPVITIDTSGVDKAKTSIIVLNGSGTDGLAAQAKERLEADGWKVSDTGNADSYVYEETLIVYRDEGDQAAAQAVADTLGVGRTVYSSVYYDLKTNVQVMIGKDWSMY